MSTICRVLPHGNDEVEHGEGNDVSGASGAGVGLGRAVEAVASSLIKRLKAIPKPRKCFVASWSWKGYSMRGQGGGCGECVRVHRSNMNVMSG